MKRESAEWLACMLVASVGLVYSLWVVPYIPTGDGPQHILSAHIENHYADAGSLYPEFYRVLPQFAGKGFSLVFTPLESVLPWRVALRVTLSLIVLAFAWGFALVVLALDRNRRATAMLGFVIALPYSLYQGFFPFVVGTTFGVYTLAFVLHRPPTTTGRRIALSLLLLVQAVCHVFTAILTGAIVVVLAVVGAPKGGRLREIGRMALVGAPAAALFALTFLERNVGSSLLKVFTWSLEERPGEISRWFVPGPGVRGGLVMGLVIAGIGATLVRARRGGASPLEHALAWLALAFVSLTLLAPLDVPGWQLLAPRFAILGMVLGLALVRPPELASPRAARALVPLATVCCIGSSLVSARLHRELADGCADTLSGLDSPLQFVGPRLPVILDPFCGATSDQGESPVPRSLLAYSTPLLYLVDHGGIGTKVFSGVSSIHAIALSGSRWPPAPDPLAQTIAQSPRIATDAKLRASVLTELAANGMPFEGIHVVGGRPDDFAVFKGRGYVTEFQHGSLFIARFEGCPAELLLPPDALDGEPVYYEYGLFSSSLITPAPRALAKRVIDRATPMSDGAIHIPLAGRPCGEIWLRVVWDGDGTSTLTAGDRTCENAHWEGRLRANVSRDRPTVRCTPPQAHAP